MQYKILEQNETKELARLLEDGWEEVMRFTNKYGSAIILWKKTTP